MPPGVRCLHRWLPPEKPPQRLAEGIEMSTAPSPPTGRSWIKIVAMLLTFATMLFVGVTTSQTANAASRKSLLSPEEVTARPLTAPGHWYLQDQEVRRGKGRAGAKGTFTGTLGGADNTVKKAVTIPSTRRPPTDANVGRGASKAPGPTPMSCGGRISAQPIMGADPHRICRDPEPRSTPSPPAAGSGLSSPDAVRVVDSMIRSAHREEHQFTPSSDRCVRSPWSSTAGQGEHHSQSVDVSSEDPSRKLRRAIS